MAARAGPWAVFHEGCVGDRLSAAFVARYPWLHHATRIEAWPAIAREGLLPAAELLRRAGAEAALRLNRITWFDLGGGVALRRQGMPDGPLRARLEPGIDPAAWRCFINEHVFLAPDVRRYLTADPAMATIRVSIRTEALLTAGLAPLWCRFNNGFLDRSPPARRRLRGFGDWRPLADWAGEPVAEVILRGAIPATLLRRNT